MITQVRLIYSRSGGRLAHLDAKASVEIRRAKSGVTNIPNLMCLCAAVGRSGFSQTVEHIPWVGWDGVGLGVGGNQQTFVRVKKGGAKSLKKINKDK